MTPQGLFYTKWRSMNRTWVSTIFVVGDVVVGASENFSQIILRNAAKLAVLEGIKIRVRSDYVDPV